MIFSPPLTGAFLLTKIFSNAIHGSDHCSDAFSALMIYARSRGHKVKCQCLLVAVGAHLPSFSLSHLPHGRAICHERRMYERNENIFLERVVQERKRLKNYLHNKKKLEIHEKKMQKPVFLLRCHPHFSSISHSVGRKDEYVCLSALAKCI